jgi:hypothetical protein
VSVDPLSDLSFPIVRGSDPLVLVGPVPGNPAAVLQFTNIEQWRQRVLTLRLLGNSSATIRRNYEHMLRVLFLVWFDGSIIKLAELAALASLEAAIKQRYELKLNGLEASLEHLVNKIGVRDADLRVIRECGGTVVSRLLRKSPPDGASLSEIRNRLAHGDPFETMPWGGLFEIVRDLIDFMYPPSA